MTPSTALKMQRQSARHRRDLHDATARGPMGTAGFAANTSGPDDRHRREPRVGPQALLDLARNRIISDWLKAR